MKQILVFVMVFASSMAFALQGRAYDAGMSTVAPQSINNDVSKRLPIAVNDRSFEHLLKVCTSPVKLGASATFRVPGINAEVVDDYNVITEPADGVIKYYDRTGNYVNVQYGVDVTDGIQDGHIKTVWCDDGTVYFQNIISHWGLGAWVKGIREGNTVTIANGQLLNYSPELGYGRYLCWCTPSEAYGYAKADEQGDFVFVVDDAAGTLTLQGSSVDRIMGTAWTDDNLFGYYGDYNTVLAGTDYQADDWVITLPEGAEVNEWFCTYVDENNTAQSVMANVAIVGDAIYFNGIFTDLNGWMKGTIDGTTVTIQPIQKIGEILGMEYFAYGTAELSADSPLVPFTMTYDAEAQILTGSGYLLANASHNRIWERTHVGSLVLRATALDATEIPTGDNVEELPYLNGFDTADRQAEMGIGDANDDGKTWTFVSGTARYNYNSRSEGDDWLVTPGIKLEAGKLYRFAVDTWCQNARNVETFEVKASQVASPSNLNAGIEIIAPTDVNWVSSGRKTIENPMFTVPNDGYYHIGIHAISAKNKYYLFMDNIVVEVGPDPNTPMAVTDLTAVAGENGALNATLTFTMPAHNIVGGDLTADLTAIITRNGEQIATVGSQQMAVMRKAPGGTAMTYVDENAVQGDNTYTVQVSDGANVSAEAEAAVYVGVDTPDAVAEVTVDDNSATTLSFTWSRVTKGANGRYINPDQLNYNLWSLRLNNSGRLRYNTKLATLLDEQAAVVEYGADEGEQQQVFFGVEAENAAGVGTWASTSIVVGKPYELPFEEAFDGSAFTNFVQKSNVTLSATDSDSDGDGRALKMAAGDEPGYGFIILGKVDLKDATKPTLLIDVKSESNDSVYIFGKKDNNNLEQIARIPVNAEFATQRIDLTPIVGERYSRVAIVAKYAAQTDSVIIDNINILDLVDSNLRITGTAAPTSIKKGESGQVSMTVRNMGANEASGYTVRITAGSEVILEQVVNEPLAMLAAATYEATVATSIFDEADELPVLYQVIYDADEIPGDNTATQTITLISSTVPVVENLQGENSTTGVNLTWDKPNTSVDEATEDFENQTVFAPFDVAGLSKEGEHTGHIGEWTLYDGNGIATLGFDGKDYPHNNDAYAWMVFNPGLTTGNTESYLENCAPHSGDQLMWSFCAWDIDVTPTPGTDHWLISPMLPGVAQTISFYAREITTRYGEENVEVLYSTTDNNPESFVKVLDDTLTTTDWKQISAELPEGTRYFAIRHTSPDGSFHYGMMVDDVTYTDGDLDPVEYNVYVDGVYYGTTKELALDIDDLDEGNHTFSVTAVYDTGEESTPVTISLVLTAIEQIGIDAQQPCDIYTIDGRMVRKNATNLNGLKGVYIINGKKVFVM